MNIFDNAMNKTLDKIMVALKSSWFPRPVAKLMEEAALSDSGIAFERFIYGSKTIAIAICIVPKTPELRTVFDAELANAGVGKNEWTAVSTQTLGEIMNYELAFRTSLFYAFQKPDAMLYASYNPTQIKTLEEKWLKNIDASEKQFAGYIPPLADN